MNQANRPPARALPQRPHLDQLKRQSKELLEAFRTGDPVATAEVRAHYQGADPAAFALHHAQLVLARAYGFDSWPKLKSHVDGVTVGDLAEAVRSGDLAAVRSALDARPELVNMDAAEHDERRSIHYAVLTRSADMVRLLMQCGADARRGVWPHRAATSALALATARGYDDIVAIVTAEEQRRRQTAAPPTGADAPSGQAAESSSDRRQISSAVLNDKPEELAALLERGLDPDERERLPLEESVYSWGGPLRECVMLRRYAMAQMLLERGADPNTNVYAATQAMTVALMADDRQMLALLERHGGVATAADAGYFGLLDDARRLLADEEAGRLRERMIEPGSSVASTLLTSGADGAHPEIVRLALAHLDWPAGDPRWHWNLMRPLDGRHGDERERSVACFRLMLERSGPHAPGPQGRTILHDVAGGWPNDHPASTDERVVLAAMLIDAGIRLDVRDDLLHSTPLGWACRWGRLELVRLLLDRGADPLEAEAESWARPVAWAVRHGRDPIVALLRERGAQ
jgi:hypothetical protein